MVCLVATQVFAESPAPSSAAVREAPVRCPECAEALGRETQGFRDDRFEAIVAALRADLPRPDTSHDYKIDDYMLLGSVRTIVARDRSLQSPGPAVKNAKGRELPVEIFLSFRRQLQGAFREGFELSDDEAAALAENALRDALVAASVSLKDFAAAAGVTFREEASLTALVRAGADKLARTSTLEKTFDVPFIAGYAPDDPRFIFIDRHVPERGKVKGKVIPAHFLLNVHERVEKLLLDRFGLIYQHAHQVAQRSERRAARSFGLDWAEYDGWMSRVTKHVGENRPLRISPRLDMTCYYSYTDEDNLRLVEEMLAARKR